MYDSDIYIDNTIFKEHYERVSFKFGYRSFWNFEFITEEVYPFASTNSSLQFWVFDVMIMKLLKFQLFPALPVSGPLSLGCGLLGLGRHMVFFTLF